MELFPRDAPSTRFKSSLPPRAEVKRPTSLNSAPSAAMPRRTVDVADVGQRSSVDCTIRVREMGLRGSTVQQQDCINHREEKPSAATRKSLFGPITRRWLLADAVPSSSSKRKASQRLSVSFDGLATATKNIGRRLSALAWRRRDSGYVYADDSAEDRGSTPEDMGHCPYIVNCGTRTIPHSSEASSHYSPCAGMEETKALTAAEEATIIELMEPLARVQNSRQRIGMQCHVDEVHCFGHVIKRADAANTPFEIRGSNMKYATSDQMSNILHLEAAVRKAEAEGAFDSSELTARFESLHRLQVDNIGYQISAATEFRADAAADQRELVRDLGAVTQELEKCSARCTRSTDPSEQGHANQWPPENHCRSIGVELAAIAGLIGGAFQGSGAPTLA